MMVVSGQQVNYEARCSLMTCRHRLLLRAVEHSPQLEKTT
jgi:hypothetical protein